jgi:hypothetical protein
LAPRLRSAQATVAHSVTVAQPGSAPVAAPATITARPQRLRKVAYVLAVVVVIAFTALSFSLTGETDAGNTSEMAATMFTPADRIAMILLGVIVAACVLLFTRPVVIADADGIRIRNLGGWREPLAWDQVAAVRFDRGSPWVTLDLPNDDMISVMAVQANDKQYAVDAVRGLRALLAASRAPAPAADRAREA